MFHSLQVKRNLISNKINFMQEFPHEFLNDLESYKTRKYQENLKTA